MPNIQIADNIPEKDIKKLGKTGEKKMTIKHKNNKKVKYLPTIH